MSFPTKAEQEAQEAQAQFTRETQAGIDAIVAAHPEISRVEANIFMIISICAEYIGDASIPPTLAIFNEALKVDPSLLGTAICITPVAATKKRIISEIAELLQNARDPYELKAEIARCGHMSLEQVIARRDQIIARRKMSQMSTTDLRKIVSDSRPATQTKTLPPEITADVIRKASSNQIRQWIRTTSAQTVNNRLFGRG